MSNAAARIPCPVCSRQVPLGSINQHLDRGCPEDTITATDSASTTANNAQVASIFTSSARKKSPPPYATTSPVSSQIHDTNKTATPAKPLAVFSTGTEGSPKPKRPADNVETEDVNPVNATVSSQANNLPAKKVKTGTTTAHIRAAMPLAERVRPSHISEIIGQEVVGFLKKIIDDGSRMPSIILWGGPGTGKTTIARCIAGMTKARFVELSGTSNGVADCKKIFTEARAELQLTGRRTVLFIDEIHRFTKSQQDIFLQPVEAGTVTLIGATTENPSFKVVNALLSRCRVLTLKPLTISDIKSILKNGLNSEYPPPMPHPELLDDELLEFLADFSSGDARTALNLLEIGISLTSKWEGGTTDMTMKTLKESITRTHVYDQKGDAHYDFISAFIKSMRGSDADATLFYLGRMLAGGEDPLFISRRMVIFASEDVGLGDNAMLPLAIATHTAIQQVGLPEARINLAHCAAALALAKKSTRSYRAFGAVEKLLRDEPEFASAPVPLHLRNAPTKLMKDLDYGKGYKYPPKYVNGAVKQEYLPDKLVGRRFLDDDDMGEREDADLH